MISRIMISERFWSKVRKSDGCWEWTGALRGKESYGVFTVGRKCVSAPRMAYELTHGKIPDGLFILHSCDNKKCVNPMHLTVGTQSQNIKDCVSRKRHIAPIGERNGMSKLTSKQVEDIRSRFDGRYGSMTRLAKDYGVSVPTIHAVINKNRWK